jgi:ATP-dependent DNA ligase
MLEEQGEVSAVPQHRSREVFYGAVLIEEPRSSHSPYPRDPGISVRRVTHQGKEVGNQGRVHPELCVNSCRIEYFPTPTIDLHYPVASNALRQVLIRCPDTDLFHSLIFRGDPGGGGERIVRLQLDHGPHDDAHGGKRFFERVELLQEGRLDAISGLVSGPEPVPERLDDVIGRHPDVGSPGLDRLQDGVQHAGHRAKGTVLPLIEAAQTVEVAEQLVGAVDEMNDHGLHSLSMSNAFPIAPPVEPMLAKLADALPAGGSFLFEPKWDGFRAIVFRGASDVFIQSRDLRPLDRYFPELHETLLEKLPKGCVIDGEIVITTPHGLDFDALQLRLHPAASRVTKLAKETPASFVGFDLLASGGQSRMEAPQSERRALLEQLIADIGPPVYLTPMTRDRDTAVQWLDRFEGAGLDGVIAKPADSRYQPGKRAMIKVKHARTAECVVAGFRWHKTGKDAVGSLLLGLYDDRGMLQHVGVTSSFTMVMRRQLAVELAPLRKNALENHPWKEWAEADASEVNRMPGAQSRWSAGKDLSWEPLRLERVVEVKYDHLQGNRFRHAATFLRWRPDKQPGDCRYDQLEVTRAYDLDKVFSSGSSGS